MTTQEVRLCGLLLREHFGEVVEKLGTHLLRNGCQNLRTILNETGMPLDLVGLTRLQALTFTLKGSEQRERKINWKGVHYACILKPIPFALLSFFPPI